MAKADNTAHLNLRGINKLGKKMPKYVKAGLSEYSDIVIRKGRRLLGKVRKPQLKRLWGAAGRDMGVFNLKKRPKNKKTPAIWQRGSWLHKWIAKEDMRKFWTPTFHVGVRGGWNPAKILEHGGSERVWGQVFYTQRPYIKKTKRKTKRAGKGQISHRGKRIMITSHKRRKIFGKGKIKPKRVTVKTPPFRLMVTSAKQTERSFQSSMVRSLRRGIKESRI